MPSTVNPIQSSKNIKPVMQRPPKNLPPPRRAKPSRPYVKVKNRPPIPKSQKINIIA